MPRPTTVRAALAIALFAVLGVSCSATPTVTRTAADAEEAPRSIAATTDEPSSVEPATPVETGEPPAALAFTEPTPPSAEFCSVSGNIWIRFEALSLIGDRSNAALTAVAFTRIAESMERATLFTEDGVESRVLLFGAFKELRETTATAFDHDWAALQAGDFYALSPAAELFEQERVELGRFIDDECPDITTDGLTEEIAAEALELIDGWGTEPSTVVPSETLPGHSIFTHVSGRLIASFPTHWTYREITSSSIVDFTAAQDLDAFLAGDKGEGVHIQLVSADSLEAFLDIIADTQTATSCTLVDQTTSDQRIVQIGQDFDCAEHGAVIEGRFNVDRQAGLIVEASFRGPEPTNAQLTRLGMVLQSILWS